MPIMVLNLSELESQPIEVREAIAFYASMSVLPIRFSQAERERHYKVLEDAGYIESL
ncbi:hypothetical protein ACX93W_05385 [Paenibacillus sp. CAU 1782]